MARRRKIPTRPRNDADPQLQPGEASDMPEADSSAPAEMSPFARQVLLGVILAVFVLFEILTILLFRSGESIVWKKELVEIDARYQRGEYARAAAELADFGERWEGARETFEWNRKMGLYHADAGDWATAAEHYAKAVEIWEKEKSTADRGIKGWAGWPAMYARAGEAYWNAGDHEKAIEYLPRELTETGRAVGDHDRANFYLGLSLFAEGRYPEAFQHFESITDRKQYAERLEPLYDKVKDDFLAPATEQANAMSLEEIVGANRAR